MGGFVRSCEVGALLCVGVLVVSLRLVRARGRLGVGSGWAPGGLGVGSGWARPPHPPVRFGFFSDLEGF